MARLPHALICDDDLDFHLALKYALKGRFECKSAHDSDEALLLAGRTQFDVILLDVQMRTATEGLEAIPKLLELDPEAAIVMISGQTDFKIVREAMRLGAMDYVPKDFNVDDLQLTLEQAIERRRLRRLQGQQGFEVLSEQKRHPLVGSSERIAQLRRTIEKVRGSAANVVIQGETGTGKEVVARQLRGIRADGSVCPFVAVDSATIQSSMAESVLFGHEKGAFTGALQASKGIFEEADGGIVYFDEIGNMSLEIQAKLLRVLQEKEVLRLGSSRPLHLEFRVVAATNRNLEEMARQGLFKADLLQRLNVLPLEIPPLRDRLEDIPQLVAHFAEMRECGRQGLVFTDEALEALRSYSWPGNVRELANVVAYVATMAESTRIEPADLPPKIRDAQAHSQRAGAGASEGNSQSFYSQVGRFEKELLSRQYAEAQGNISRMALQLGMDRSHLYTKLREHGIHQPRSKNPG